MGEESSTQRAPKRSTSVAEMTAIECRPCGGTEPEVFQRDLTQGGAYLWPSRAGCAGVQYDPSEELVPEVAGE